MCLKLLVDAIPKIKVIATCSSSFELASQVGEPLTGRKTSFHLYPLSAMELKEQFGPIHVKNILDNLLIYGSYPETLQQDNTAAKVAYLCESLNQTNEVVGA